MKREITFKINTPAFLEEVAENALEKNMGILKVPLNVLKKKLALIADRCAEINDPVLNKILCDMALYEESDMYSKNYNAKLVEKVNKDYRKYLTNLKNLKSA